MSTPAVRRLAVELAVICAAAVLVSCTNNDSTPSPPTTRAADDTTSASPARATTLMVNRVVQTAGVDQGLTGEIGVSASGCVTVNNRFMVAPHGSTLSSDGRTITIPDQGTYVIGDQFNGGGYTRRDVAATKFQNMLPTEYQKCGDGTFAFINAKI